MSHIRDRLVAVKRAMYRPKAVGTQQDHELRYEDINVKYVDYDNTRMYDNPMPESMRSSYRFSYRTNINELDGTFNANSSGYIDNVNKIDAFGFDVYETEE